MFGLSRAEFWKSSPRQFWSLRRVYKDQQDAEFLRAGIVAAAVLNAAGGKVKPTDFIPGYVARPTGWRSLLDKVRALNAHLGGRSAQ